MADAAKAVWTPPPTRTPDEWADQCRVLPQGSAAPGPFRSSRTPYMVPILRATCDPAFDTVVGILAAQSGKTDGLLNVIGHRMDDRPEPILYFGPTQKLVESVSSDRFTKMIRAVPSLFSKLAKGKSDKITEKFIAGVRLGFGWAGSATEMSSHAAALVVIDERDRMQDVKGEGDPVELGRGRLTTFADGVLVAVSTPTEGNAQPYVHPETGIEHWGDLELKDESAHASPIWKLWQEGTRHEWAVPCPDCREFFVPRLRHLKWPDGASAAAAARDARLCCPRCGSLIEDSQKAAMNAAGRFLAPGQRVVDGVVIGDLPPNKQASFWVSGLCSPWKSWGDRARAFVKAARSGSESRLRAVINLQFGELFARGGEGPDWRDVEELRGGYESGTVPDGVQVLTCGVDVQKNRLVYAVRGWGWKQGSWGVEAGELWGDTELDDVWEDLGELLGRDFGGKRVRLMLIDSGYKPGEKDRTPDNKVYVFCRRHRGRAHATKGHDRQDKPFYASKIDVSHRGKIIKEGIDLWHLDTDYFKSWVHARLGWPKDKDGGWALPSDATADYCMQLTAEQRTVLPSGRVSWVKVRRENHYLDVEALNVAAAHILRLHALRRPERPAEQAPAADVAAPAPDGAKAAEDAAKPAEDAAKAAADAARNAAARRRTAPRRGGWTTNWRS